MKLNKTLFLFALLVAMTMTACSGLGDTGGGNGGGGGGGGGGNTGNATLSFTLRAAPLTPPPGTNILSYTLTVGGATLTPASGSVTNLPGLTIDVTRLQSDSAFLGTVSVPAGTYTSLTVSLSSAVVTYCRSISGVAGCTAGSVTQFSGGAVAPVITFPNGGLVVSNSQQAGVSVVFDMSKTLTLTGQNVTAVDLSGTGVLSALSTLTLGPTRPSTLTSTELDYLEDITGNVSVSGNNVTIKTATHGSLTATANGSTFYSPNCTVLGLAPTIACVQNNQVASMDAILNNDGTMTMISYDPISAATATNNDWVEGTVVFPPAGNLFNIVLNDADVSSSGTVLPSTIPLGSLITVNLAPNSPFGVDTQDLDVPAEASSFSLGALLPGQDVAVHITSFATTGGSPTGILVNGNAVELRFSRVAGTAAQSGTPSNFSLSSTSLPPYYGFNTTNQLVELTSGTPPASSTTNYDGIAAPGNITSGDTYSIRALYFGQFSAFPFVAAKVRQNP